MREQLSSYDELGPMEWIGPTSMFIMHDPLGIGKTVRHDFTLNLWLLWRTDSKAIARLGERTIKEGPGFNDYYGFGTSRTEAQEIAQKMLSDFSGSGITVSIETTLSARPVIHDTKREAFYNHSVRCIYVPEYQWRIDPDESAARAFSTSRVFTIWQDGAFTPEGEELQAKIDLLRSRDGAGHIRKGDLR